MDTKVSLVMLLDLKWPKLSHYLIWLPAAMGTPSLCQVMEGLGKP